MTKVFYFKKLQKIIPVRPKKKATPIMPGRNVLFFTACVFIGLLLIISQIIYPNLYYSRQAVISASIDNSQGSKNAYGESDYFLPSLTKSDLRREEIKKEIPASFLLSIPKIGLENVIVYSQVDGGVKEIYGPVLEKGIAHYLGTPLPGEAGKSIIFGHSSFPWVYKSTNYLTIFTNLPKLRVGDQILITISGNEKIFIVTKTKTIKPENLTSALSLEDDKPTLILMTCVPPGQKTLRLLVFASQSG